MSGVVLRRNRARIERGSALIAVSDRGHDDSMETSGSWYSIDGLRLRPDDEAWQSTLERAHGNGVQPLCLCRPGGVQMHIANYGNYVVKRLPDTGHQHHPTCPSFEPSPSQSGLGEVLGEAVIERAPDRVEVRLDFPPTRRIGRPVTPTDLCGGAR
jgi:hypothetical protein